MTLIPIQILYAHRHLGITQYDNDTTFFNDLQKLPYWDCAACGAPSL